MRHYIIGTEKVIIISENFHREMKGRTNFNERETVRLESKKRRGVSLLGFSKDSAKLL